MSKRVRKKRKDSPYATLEWRKARLAHLEIHPDCQACNKKMKKRQQVHHVQGIGNDPKHTDLMTLCWSCHKILELIASRRGSLTQKVVVKLWQLARLKWTT